MTATTALPGVPGLEASHRHRVCVRSALDLRHAMQHARSGALALDASGLDRILSLDAPRRLLEVQAGVAWSAVAEYLASSAPELAPLAADPGLPPSVGQSVSANAAGPDGRPMCAHVEALTLVTADGELRRASRETNRDLFALALGGLGLIGVPYSVTLRLESLRRSCAAPRADLRIEHVAPLPRSESDLTLLVPPERLDALIDRLRAAAAEWRIDVLGAAARLTSAEDETFLRWARREYAEIRLGLAAPHGLGARVRAAQARRHLIDCAIAAGGSTLPACLSHASPAQAENCYPQLRSFLAEKQRLDPAERLSSAWYRHVRGLFARDRVTVRWG